MLKFAPLLALLCLLTGQDGPRPRYIEVTIDTNGRTLGAYQFELVSNSPDVKLTGVEGNNALSFHLPYYDRVALARSERIIIASYTLKKAPTGKVRVATLHVQETGPVPNYTAKLIVAADADGKPIEAKISVIRKGGK